MIPISFLILSFGIQLMTSWGPLALQMPAIHAQGFDGANGIIGILDTHVPSHVALQGGMVDGEHRPCPPELLHLVDTDHTNLVGGVVRTYAPRVRTIYATTTTLAASMQHLIDERCDVINCSFIMLEEHPERDQFYDLVQLAISKNIIVVAAVGNDGTDSPPNPLTTWPGVIGVGIYTQNGTIHPKSSSGANVQCTFPGANILVLTGTDGTSYRTGSSLASPGVAAVICDGIAWRRSVGKTALTHKQIYDAIGPNLTTSRCFYPPSFLAFIMQ
jgi:hypothetical protein